eukprot:757566_1
MSDRGGMPMPDRGGMSMPDRGGVPMRRHGMAPMREMTQMGEMPQMTGNLRDRSVPTMGNRGGLPEMKGIDGFQVPAGISDSPGRPMSGRGGGQSMPPSLIQSRAGTGSPGQSIPDVPTLPVDVSSLEVGVSTVRGNGVSPGGQDILKIPIFRQIIDSAKFATKKILIFFFSIF